MTTIYKRSPLSPVWLLILSLFMMPSQVFANKVAGITLEDSVTIDGQELLYNGAGIRKKLFIKLYVGSLYVGESLKGGDAQSIVQADEPMAIQLNILSDLLTRDKLVKALNDGFKKSTGNNTAPVQEGITAMLDALDRPVRPGEVFQIVYTPASGTNLISSEDSLAVIPGLPFKQALFGIWLSDSPAQASLKKAMLGQ